MKVPSINAIKTGFQKRSPEILFGIGIGGMFVSTILAVRATPKALKKIDEAKKANGGEVSKTEAVKAAWTCYVPTAGTMIFSVTCLVGSNSIHRRRLAAAATAYSITDTAFRTYRDKAIDIIGEKKEKTIREAAAAEKVPDDIENRVVYVSSKGTTRCFDVLTNQQFDSDMETIRSAVNNLNERLLYEHFLTLNDFYDELRIPLVDDRLGNELGWHIDDGLLEVTFTSKLIDGTPYLVLDYISAPRYDFSRKH